MKVLRATTYLLALAVVYAVSFFPSPAAADERLQGAWGVEGIACDEIFASSQGHPTFIKHYGEALSGFIVDGRNVKGANSSCELVSSQVKSDEATYLMSCNDGIMFDTTSISIRFIGSDTIVRYDKSFPDVATTYHRCSK